MSSSTNCSSFLSPERSAEESASLRVFIESALQRCQPSRYSCLSFFAFSSSSRIFLTFALNATASPSSSSPACRSGRGSKSTSGVESSVIALGVYHIGVLQKSEESRMRGSLQFVERDQSNLENAPFGQSTAVRAFSNRQNCLCEREEHCSVGIHTPEQMTSPNRICLLTIGVRLTRTLQRVIDDVSTLDPH